MLGLKACSTTAGLEKDSFSGFQSKISHSQVNLYQGSEWLNQSVTAMNCMCSVFLVVDIIWSSVHWRVWGNQTQCGDERLWRNAESTGTTIHWVNHCEFDWSFEKPANQLETHTPPLTEANKTIIDHFIWIICTVNPWQEFHGRYNQYTRVLPCLKFFQHYD